MTSRNGKEPRRKRLQTGWKMPVPTGRKLTYTFEEGLGNVPDQYPPPPEASNTWLTKRSRALIEFATRLKNDKSMTFADADAIALLHDTVTADLLAYAEGSLDCVIDYSQGMIICP